MSSYMDMITQASRAKAPVTPKSTLISIAKSASAASAPLAIVSPLPAKPACISPPEVPAKAIPQVHPPMAISSVAKSGGKAGASKDLQKAILLLSSPLNMFLTGLCRPSVGPF